MKHEWRKTKDWTKRYLKKFFNEMVPIIVGIIIGMYITNWNENRKDIKYIDKMLLSVNKDLVETDKDITNNLSKQEAFIDTLDLYFDNNNISILDITAKAQGIFVPTINLNSWKAISNSRIELIDYDKVSILVNIEGQRDDLEMKTEKLVDFIYSNIYETDKGKKELMRIMMTDIIGKEISLQKEIEKMIADNNPE